MPVFRTCLALGLVAGCMAAAPRFSRADTPEPEFERDIAPLLAAHCWKCHGLESVKAGLDLRTAALASVGGDSGPAVTPADPESPLVVRVRDRSMPPEGELPLTEAQIELIERWVASGAHAAEAGEAPQPDATLPASEITAEDRAFWSFRALSPSEPPAVSQSQLARSPVDAFVLSRLEERGLTQSPQAEPRVLVRRLYLDLCGLPPTPEETAAFVADAESRGADAACERLVDRLLASPHFGERFGRHWLDAAGYVDVFGSDNDAAIIKTVENKWLYRDYVVTAFNEDLPYDQFLREQLAGDELTDWRKADSLTPEAKRLLIATGYLRAAVDDTAEKELNTALIRFRVLHLTLDVVGTSLLGLTTGCARCHTHKFDPIPQRDYYRLMAVFTPAYNPQDWLPLDQRYLADVSPPEQARIEASNAAVEARASACRQEIASVEAPIRATLEEQKAAQLPESIRADTLAAIHTAATSRNEVQQYLAGKFESQLAIAPEELAAALPAAEREQVAQHRAREAQINAEKRSWGRLQALYDVGPAPATFLLRRGDHETPGAEVPPGFLSVLGPAAPDFPPAETAGTSGRRLALARWLTAPGTPAASLAARVMVNRVWQHLLGEGIVKTADNFGRAGAPPTHPELLEWLAADFIQQGWHVKALVRQIVLSETYRQESAAGGEGQPLAMQADPENKLLWRARTRRLDSEVVRDCLLAAGGRLDRTLGGPPLPLENRPDGMVVIDAAKLPAGSTADRRSLYVLARRNYHLSLLADFDQPSVATNCPQRTQSAVVLQSLTLLNDPFVRQQAEQFAARVLRERTDPSAQVALAFELAFARPPDAEELAWSLELLDKHAARGTAGEAVIVAPPLAELCHMLLCTSEFLYAP